VDLLAQVRGFIVAELADSYNVIGSSAFGYAEMRSF